MGPVELKGNWAVFHKKNTLELLCIRYCKLNKNALNKFYSVLNSAFLSVKSNWQFNLHPLLILYNIFDTMVVLFILAPFVLSCEIRRWSPLLCEKGQFKVQVYPGQFSSLPASQAPPPLLESFHSIAYELW
jgi:hypothetical protein